MAVGFLERTGGGPLVGDGAMGTFLAKKGLPSGSSPESWILENPEAVSAIHKEYAASGADIVKTNTFGGTPIKLSHYGLEDRAGEINRLAVGIARTSGVSVAGSVGPTGKLLEPYGELTEEEAFKAFEVQAAGLAEGGVDLFICETFSALDEILLAVRACVATGIPVFACMSFDMGGRTMMGVTPAAFAKAMEGTGAAGIGANCGGGSAQLRPVVDELLSNTLLPVIALPNAGLPSMSEGVVTFSEAPEVLGAFARDYRDRLAIIGSCCGSTPEHTAAIAAAVKS